MRRRIAGTVIHSASSFLACSNIHRPTSSCFFCSASSNSGNNNIYNAASASAKKHISVKERRPRLGRPHPRNSFQGTYDMERLTSCYPPLGPHVILGPTTGRPTVNWSDPAAVKALNTAVLVADYGVSPRYAAIVPVGTLCPPVPGRADYVHTIADVLQKSMWDDNDEDEDDNADNNNNDCTVPIGKNSVGLDIGTGASCIYPTIAASIYGWRMIGSDIQTASIASARDIVKANGHERLIEVRTQQHSTSVLDGVWDSKEVLDFVMCNPPFYSSREAFQVENARKLKGLSKNKNKKKRGRNNNNNNNTGMPITTKVEVNATTTSNNFGGIDSELWCEGGEVAFVKNMILESERYGDHCLFFTSLVSRQEHLKTLNPTHILKNVAREHTTRKGEKNSDRRRIRRRRVEIQTVIPLAVGRKTSNILLWSFLGKDERRKWARTRNWNTISFASP